VHAAQPWLHLGCHMRRGSFSPAMAAPTAAVRKLLIAQARQMRSCLCNFRRACSHSWGAWFRVHVFHGRAWRVSLRAGSRVSLRRVAPWVALQVGPPDQPATYAAPALLVSDDLI
jgi:hypothetical protein